MGSQPRRSDLIGRRPAVIGRMVLLRSAISRIARGTRDPAAARNTRLCRESRGSVGDTVAVCGTCGAIIAHDPTARHVAWHGVAPTPPGPCQHPRSRRRTGSSVRRACDPSPRRTSAAYPVMAGKGGRPSAEPLRRAVRTARRAEPHGLSPIAAHPSAGTQLLPSER